MSEESSKKMLAGCQDLPAELRYKQMLGKWFPGMKFFLAFWAFLLGVNVMTHEILDCVELQGACENYRRNNREECNPTNPKPIQNFDPDCECEHSIQNCYSTESKDGKAACVTCDQVAQNFIDFLWWTGSFVVLLGFLLMTVSLVEVVVVRKDLLSKHSLIALAFADIGFLGGLVSTAMRKRNIASSISALCRSEDQEAMDYAPTTMGNLCHYHWMLEWIVSFCIALVLVSLFNLFWSVFGVVVGIPADFQQFEDGKEERTFDNAASDPRGNIAPLDLPQGGSPFADAATSDIHVDVK